MPEGPSIVLLKEKIARFKGKKITGAKGNAKIDLEKIIGRKITGIKTWGKHLLICLPDSTIRIHLLMFGSYSINEASKPARSLRLHLQFSKGDLYFYTCAVKLLEAAPDEVYDWSADVMNDAWDKKAAKVKLREKDNMLICDALLDQEIFAGVGNVIKNEVLYRCRIHPESKASAIAPQKLTALVKDVSIYSFEFLKWKKANELKKHWEAYTKKECTRCNLPFEKKYCGKTKRRTFFCSNCQILYQ